MKFDYKTLQLLRKNTKLGPIAYFKVLAERNDAKEYQIIMNQLENCQLGVDYSKADQLEANLRFELWKNKVIAHWLKYCSNRELDEFALDVLKQQEETKAHKRILKK